MSENAASAANGAGDDRSASGSAEGRVQREARLTAEMAVVCATKMFTLRAAGLDLSGMSTVSGRPTNKEIGFDYTGVVEATGECAGAHWLATVPMLWERLSGGVCVGGRCAAAAAYRAVAAATFLAA